MSSIAPEEIVERVRAAGVVGAGGAGFPTHVKICAKVDTVIANGAECEPLLYCDQLLMAAHPELVVQGVRLVMRSTQAQRAFIALKRKYHAAIEALEQEVQKDNARSQNEPPIQLHIIEKSTYPAGDEFVLVHEVTGRMVPETGIPLNVGCVVQNVGTLANIARAVYDKQAVTHRYLTLNGEVAEPRTVRVPVGMSYGEVLALAGGMLLPEGQYRVVRGGPMTGALAASLDEPVIKTTSGLIALPADNVVVRFMARPIDRWIKYGQSTCDQCRDCTTLCPRYLLGHNFRPHEVMRAIAYHHPVESDVITGAVLCCECRLCEAYACPLELSAMQFYRKIKSTLRDMNWKNDRHKRTDLTPHPFREGRLVPLERLVDRLALRKYSAQRAPLDERAVSPSRVVIPLRQHLGAPSVPVVSVGDTVTAGDLIGAIPEGKLGANVHASINGRITAVTDASITIVP